MRRLVDVRRFPGSRSNPDVRREALGEWQPGREPVADAWLAEAAGTVVAVLWAAQDM